MEDIKDAMIKSKVPKIFTGAVNIRNPGEGSNFYNLRVHSWGPHEESELECYCKEWREDDGE